MSGVASTPHDPGGSGGESTGEGEHLDAGITSESRDGDDTVLDGIGSTGTDSDGSEHLEDSTEDHGLAVADRSRRYTGSPRVGNIVCRN